MNRKEVGEELYRQKFEEFGLSDRFEFISRDWNTDHGRKAFVKCKVCGARFSTYCVAEIFKGRLHHLLCPECGSASDRNDASTRSKQMKEAMAFYVRGHGVKETAEKYGFSVSQISNRVKQLKLSNGRDWQEVANQNRMARTKHSVDAFLALRGYELLEDWNGRRKAYDVRIVSTGKIVKRNGSSLTPNHKTDIARRAKMKKAFVDRGINIDALIRRDGDTCYICGKKTDFSDKTWGNFGPDYPTIDHVIPLAAGGKHSWDNVKVCCGMCNILKSDKVVGV